MIGRIVSGKKNWYIVGLQSPGNPVTIPKKPQDLAKYVHLITFTDRVSTQLGNDTSISLHYKLVYITKIHSLEQFEAFLSEQTVITPRKWE